MYHGPLIDGDVHRAHRSDGRTPVLSFARLADLRCGSRSGRDHAIDVSSAREDGRVMIDRRPDAILMKADCRAER
jgi:hypothetical protein